MKVTVAENRLYRKIASRQRVYWWDFVNLRGWLVACIFPPFVIWLWYQTSDEAEFTNKILELP